MRKFQILISIFLFCQVAFSQDDNGDIFKVDNEFIENKTDDEKKNISDFLNKFPSLTETKNPVIADFSIDAYENDIFQQMQTQIQYLENDSLYSTFENSTKYYLVDLAKYNYLDRLMYYTVRENLPLDIRFLPSIMFDLIKPKLVDNKSVLNLEKYRSFLDKYYTYIAFQNNNFTNFPNKNILADKILNTSYSGLTSDVRTYFISKNLFENHKLITKETFKKYYKLISSDIEFKKYEKPLNDILEANIFYTPVVDEKTKKIDNKLIEKSEKKSDDLVFYDLKENPVRLSDFKGKVIYIDVWASWCSPCRRQFPYSKELQSMFTRKEKSQIVFLYISIDENELKWKNAVEQMQIKGVNVIAKGGWKSNIIKHFQIRGIPRCILIDKQGNVANDNARKPSQTEDVYRDIKSLINK